MKLAYAALAGAMIFMGSIVGMLKDPEYKNFPPTASGDWIAFGDSLTEGLGAERGSDYPTVLGKELGVTIRNYGVSGDTTQDGLRRLNSALEVQPRVVLLCLGGNDGLQVLPAERAFANLGKIIDAFQEQGAFVVLIGIRSATLQDTNSKGFEELAREKQVLYIPDMLRGVFGKNELMADYVHPNDAGYRKIAERLAKELRPIMDELEA